MKVPVAAALAVVALQASPPALQDALLARLAVELAAERDVAPLSLDADGSGLRGVAYDRFVQAHLAARVARLSGTPLDPLRPPASLLSTQLVVVAVPLVCGERTVRPADVDIDDHGRAVPKGPLATGPAIQTLLPGATVPAGAVAVRFADTSLRQGEVVRISYAGALCSGTSTEIVLPVSATAARALERPAVEIQPNQQAPPGPVTLNIEGVVDLDGRLRHAMAPEAMTAFGVAALAAAVKVRFEPARINRSPTPWTAGVLVTFGVAEAPPPTSEASTPDVPSLTTASSQCPVSLDATYGVSGSNAIRIGGGSDGAARALRYLSVLRGPAGQGLQYRSVGRVLLASRQVLLDGFEVQHAGLAQPVRIYFDTSLDGPLTAPKGFACAGPIVVK